MQTPSGIGPGVKEGMSLTVCLFFYGHSSANFRLTVGKTSVKVLAHTVSNNLTNNYSTELQE